MKRTIQIFTLLIAVFFLNSCEAENKEIDHTNFIIILIDDMGYGDVGCYGATGFTSPNLDQMAAEGMRFTNFYAAQPVCSASRAGILTGCYPNRIGFSGALFPHHSIGLNPDETTIAEMLKEKGYVSGAFGKWHLGHHNKFMPLQHGFDEYVGIPYSNDMWPIKVDGTRAEPGEGRGDFPDLPLIVGNSPTEFVTTLQGQDRLSTLLTEKTVDFIKRHADQAFFAYLAHPMGHVPLGVSDKFRGKSEQGLYGDVMMELDWSLGEIMKALKANDIEDNTVVIFTSDNGPWLNYGNHGGSSGGLREGKTTSWEGGQRVPFIIKWPNGIPAGKVCNKLGSAIDILPSFAEIADTPLPKNKIDGVSITSLWNGSFETEPRKDMWFYFGKNNLNAVRKGNWKLVLPHSWMSYDTAPGNNGYGGKRIKKDVEAMELYNMMRDPGEQYNVVESYPGKVIELMQVVEAARSELGDLNVGIDQGQGTRAIGSITTSHHKN